MGATEGGVENPPLAEMKNQPPNVGHGPSFGNEPDSEECDPLEFHTMGNSALQNLWGGSGWGTD